MRGWRTIYHANGHQKKAGVAIPVTDKLDFKQKTITRDEEKHYIIIKGSIQQEDLTIINYVPSLGAAKYISQIIRNLRKLIDNNTIIVGDFNIPLRAIDLPSRKSTRKQ